MERKFRSEREAAAYRKALGMHEVLMAEISGRGNAYRFGYEGRSTPDRSWPRDWASWPVYAAGEDNRKLST